ncbi:hypothetical protein [Halorubrum vacuolatum]|uniref:Uncharacterized protein n=1 Tax=Halorubrum vacuolatum TaxID=63740 RepID=A0A238WPR6_HALVU|nr:hypothetical protein [Halorubrum vacuolatum]SNR47669.1 hypothetical protein SAMN06264855_108151 [Halorubrum vacuolatum]
MVEFAYDDIYAFVAVDVTYVIDNPNVATEHRVTVTLVPASVMGDEASTAVTFTVDG